MVVGDWYFRGLVASVNIQPGQSVSGVAQTSTTTVIGLAVRWYARSVANQNATRHVITNLFREDGMWDTVGGVMGRHSTRDEFENRAKSWLRDNSNLSTRTIDNADWDEVYSAMQDAPQPD